MSTIHLLYLGFFVYFIAVVLAFRWIGKPEADEPKPRRILAAQFTPKGGEPRPMVYFDEDPTIGQALAAARSADAPDTKP
jgi:hypothetical protein